MILNLQDHVSLSLPALPYQDFNCFRDTTTLLYHFLQKEQKNPTKKSHRLLPVKVMISTVS